MNSRTIHNYLACGTLGVFSIGMIGCSGRDLPDTQLSNPTVLKPGEKDAVPLIKQPIATFDLPKTPIHIKDKIEVGVNLVVPENSKVPEAVTVAFVKGDLEVGSTTAAIQQAHSDRSFKLKAELLAPQVAGKYALRATYVYNTFVEETGKADSAPKTIYLKSPDTEVEVLP